VVRSWQDTARAGLNRTTWNLEGDAHPAPRMRTKPMYNDEFEMGADGTRQAPGFGSISVLMPPGRYTVRLIVNGTPYTQPLVVLKDPNNFATVAEIIAQTRVLLAIQRDHQAAGQMLTTIENVRVQIQGMAGALTGAADLRAEGDSLEGKFIDVEQRLIDLRMTGRGQDGVRWPVRLGGQLGYLAGTIASSDHAPTAQQREVAAVLAKETRDVHAALQGLIAKELADYNAKLKARGLKPIEVPPATP
jgi:hypothetical protein